MDIVSDIGDWNDIESLKEYLSPEVYEIFTNEDVKDFKTSDDVRTALQKKGYDGITYINYWEGGRGQSEEPSWIVFEPEQMRILKKEKIK